MMAERVYHTFNCNVMTGKTVLRLLVAMTSVLGISSLLYWQFILSLLGEILFCNTLIRYTIILPQSPGIDKNNEASYNFSIRSYN